MSCFADSEIVRCYVDANPRSQAHAERAQVRVPTGTSRSLLKYRPFPFYVAESAGLFTTDIDGNRRIDFNCNYTSQILGHIHPQVVSAVKAQLSSGTAHSGPGSLEVEFAELLADRIRSVDQVIFVNSGTEAVMAALRAARAFTGRNRIAKFEGGYHGWSDFVAVGGHDVPRLDDPRGVTEPSPDVAGLPGAATKDVSLVRYNDCTAVRELVQRYGKDLAAVIVEPMLGSGGMIPATAEFLATLREDTARAGIVLICDEVVTLRLAEGGAQALYALDPDLTTMGKIIGGGFPVGAVGGRREVMRCFAGPEQGGSVASMGTFNANPVSIRAGLETMRILDGRLIEHINTLGERARAGMAAVIEQHGAPAQVTGMGSLFQLHWTTAPLNDARGSNTADTDCRLLCYLGLANRGFQLSTRCGGAVSTPMTSNEVDRLVAAVDGVLGNMKHEGWF